MPETYNAVMNAIFSAQKAGVLVDAAVLGEPSTFLQQAAYLTGRFREGRAGPGRVVSCRLSLAQKTGVV